MREGLKDDRYNLRQPPPTQLVPRERRLGVRERIRPDGRVEIALDRGSLDDSHRHPEAAGRGGRRHLLPAQLARRNPRACHGGGRARRHARRLRRALGRRAAADQGVRPPLHDRRQRLRRPGAGALPDPTRGTAARGRARGASPHHPVAWRRGDHRRGGAAGGRRRAFRSGGRRRRQPVCGPAAGPRRPHPVRHGRHLHGHLPRGRRRGCHRLGPAHRRPARGPAKPGHRQHRGRRRLNCARRRQRRAARRARERRRATGTRLLWPRRHRSHRYRRQPRPRLPRSRQFPRWSRAPRSQSLPRAPSIASPASSASTAWPRPRASTA